MRFLAAKPRRGRVPAWSRNLKKAQSGWQNVRLPRPWTRYVELGVLAMRINRALGALCLVLPLVDAFPALADARNGETLARRWCSSCHVVAPDQSAPAGEAPAFSSIARSGELDAGKIALFLLLPHPNMPDMGLSRQAAADLAAYIASLR